MDNKLNFLDDIEEIKNAINRNYSFVSLSGLSGVAAGVCGLIGAFFLRKTLGNIFLLLQQKGQHIFDRYVYEDFFSPYPTSDFKHDFFHILFLTFVAAVISSVFFSYVRSRKTQVPLWHKSGLKLFFEFAFPFIFCALFCFVLYEVRFLGMILPLSLLLYGLCVVNSSKWAYPQIKYLGYTCIGLSIPAITWPLYQVYFWALGFGVAHIAYGFIMWYKYERALN